MAPQGGGEVAVGANGGGGGLAEVRIMHAMSTRQEACQRRRLDLGLWSSHALYIGACDLPLGFYTVPLPAGGQAKQQSTPANTFSERYFATKGSKVLFHRAGDGTSVDAIIEADLSAGTEQVIADGTGPLVVHGGSEVVYFSPDHQLIVAPLP
jgi:hypothetical protein